MLVTVIEVLYKMISQVERYLSITSYKLAIFWDIFHPHQFSTILFPLFSSEKTNKSELDNDRFLAPFHLGLENIRNGRQWDFLKMLFSQLIPCTQILLRWTILNNYMQSRSSPYWFISLHPFPISISNIQPTDGINSIFQFLSITLLLLNNHNIMTIIAKTYFLD